MNYLLTKNIFRFALELKKELPRRLMDRQKNRPKIFTPEDRKIQYNPLQAIQLLKVHNFTSFTETVQVCIQLGVNPKIGEQLVRGSAFMPAGLGKNTKVAVLCQQSLKQQLNKLGVDKFIDKEGFTEIASGKTDFQLLFTTPQLLPRLKPFGKILGPRGLMPNPKVGTLVNDKEMAAAVTRAKAGQVSFKVDAGKNIHAQIGKITFTEEQLLKNFKSLMLAIQSKKPANLKGKYYIGGFIKSTMGPRWKLNIEHIDPRSQKSIWSLVQ